MEWHFNYINKYCNTIECLKEKEQKSLHFKKDVFHIKKATYIYYFNHTIKTNISTFILVPCLIIKSKNLMLMILQTVKKYKRQVSNISQFIYEKTKLFYLIKIKHMNFGRQNIKKKGKTKKNRVLKTLSLDGCYDKEWVVLKKPKLFKNFQCLLCKQIANNAMGLVCNKHEDRKEA
ncbi:hypothetical protein RFI_02250, partial [Reticulomyxa filosa]